MRKFLATRKPSAKVTRGHSGHEITFVCFQSRALPAALEHAGRAVPVPVPKGPSVAEAGNFTVTKAHAIADPVASKEAFIFDQGHPSASSDLIAETDAHTEEFADPKEFTHTQTCSFGKA